MFSAQRPAVLDAEFVDELTHERIARNNAVFRDANEQIEAAAQAYGLELRVPFICECADRGCHAIVRMSLENYGEIRANPRRFFNAADHQEGGEEAAAVVAERDGYVIVEKQGRAGEVAEGLDTRSTK
jgi:hypothetical protein